MTHTEGTYKNFIHAYSGLSKVMVEANLQVMCSPDFIARIENTEAFSLRNEIFRFKRFKFVIPECSQHLQIEYKMTSDLFEMVEEGENYIQFVPKSNLTEDVKFNFMAFIPGHDF